MKQGVEHAWDLLAASDPQEVCDRLAVDFSTETNTYTVPVLGHPIAVDVAARTMTGSGAEADFILGKAAYFSRISILRYLLDAQKIMPTGRLIAPTDLKSGQIYLQGSHLLPTGGIAARFAADPEGFVKQAARFGGERRAHGDVAVEMWPLPRVPIALILWLEDEEFPARSYLLFDETCEQHVPPDILWSVAMLCALAMLRP